MEHTEISSTPLAVSAVLNGLCLTLSFSEPLQSPRHPRYSVRFLAKGEDRILPLPGSKNDENAVVFSASYTYEIWNLFRDVKRFSALTVQVLRDMQPVAISVSAETLSGWSCEASHDGWVLRPEKSVALHPAYRNFLGFFRANTKERKKALSALIVRCAYLPFLLMRPKAGRISFCTERSTSLSGNAAFVYNALQGDPALELQVLAHGPRFSPKNLFRFFYLYATSEVVVVDDYYLFLSYVPRRKKVKAVQLWHAAGSLKTIGFSRLGHDTALAQSSKNHRQYDAAIMSAEQDVYCYAEGFGIPTRCVLPLGISRTDVLLQPEYAEKARRSFYGKYPALQGKRVVLFAPTFRGGGNGDAFYPVERFPLDDILDALPEDTVFVLKMHPYVHERIPYSSAHAHRVVECSDSGAELNDLLFIADVLITDYSSCVFEAALLKLPMLFYTYDMEEYIRDRDFYFDPRDALAGKTVRTPEELIKALRENDFETERLARFSAENLAKTDGNATARAAALVRSMMGQKQS